jgi:hypothetical protein
MNASIHVDVGDVDTMPWILQYYEIRYFSSVWETEQVVAVDHTVNDMSMCVTKQVDGS